jgi:ubiquinone/menaquinone biosynthesis C-methylase UbiE
VKSVTPLKSATVLDIGSGTGISALAFAPHCERVLCYDINEISIAAAEERHKYFSVANITQERELFDRNCRFVRSGQEADIALFVAVLEHMTFSELEEAVGVAWRALKPGGHLVIAETPNRLAPNDYHTSWIPFFQALPLEIRLRYLDRSPRSHLIGDVNGVPPASREERLTRWGCGISYHDLEIVLGANVHDWVVADGHEPILSEIAPRFVDDEILEDAFGKLGLKVNRAFSRWFLYLIIRKPA